MICPKCGAYVTSENKTCRNCGCSLEGLVDMDEHIYDLNEQKRRANLAKYEMKVKSPTNCSTSKSMDLKRLSFIIICGFMLILLATTNPTKSEYSSWLKNKVANQTTNELEKGLVIVFADPIIQTATTENNYIFFSIFKTPDGNNRYVNTIGIFHHFIPIKEFQNTK